MTKFLRNYVIREDVRLNTAGGPTGSSGIRDTGDHNEATN